jgi:hypothetical protein
MHRRRLEMSNGHKSGKGKNKPHPDPKQPSTDQHKCNSGGNTHVRGEVEVSLAPYLIEKYDATQKKNKSRENTKRTIEIVTLLGVFAAAGFSGWQGHLTSKIVKISQKTFDTSQRPYIGASAIDTRYLSKDSKGVIKLSQEPIKDPLGIDVRVEIKNFGPVPGSDFDAHWRWFFDDKEVFDKGRLPSTPSTLYPGQPTYLTGQVLNPEFGMLSRGTSKLVVEVTVNYDGPNGHFYECSRHQYSADINGFFGLGKCLGK